MNVINEADALEGLKDKAPALFAGLGEINPKISDRDGMYNPQNPRQYFKCGAEAAQISMQAFAASDTPASRVRKVLDYACGYGRVIRFMRSAFPDAQIVGADIDGRALKHLHEILGEETQLLDPDNDGAQLHEKFDLIWVGSLFTHIPKDRVMRLLCSLVENLSPEGRIIFTMHGKFVVQRLEAREKTYNLPEEAVEEILAAYRCSGFGFASYAGQANYGISIADPDFITEMICELGFAQMNFLERGWVGHQDVFVATCQ